MHGALPSAEIILYGSEARGDARIDSDIDLLVLLDNEKVSFPERDFVIGLLYDIELEYATEISPVIHSKKYWQSRPRDFFKENIEKEGIRL